MIGGVCAGIANYMNVDPAIIRLLNEVQGDEDYYVKKAVVWIRRNFKKGR